MRYGPVEIKRLTKSWINREQEHLLMMELGRNNTSLHMAAMSKAKPIHDKVHTPTAPRNTTAATRESIIEQVRRLRSEGFMP